MGNPGKWAAWTCLDSFPSEVLSVHGLLLLTLGVSSKFSFVVVFEASMGWFLHLEASEVPSEIFEVLPESFSSLRATFRFCFSIFFRSLCSNFSLLIAFFSSLSNRLSFFRFFSSSFTLLYSLISWGSYSTLLSSISSLTTVLFSMVTCLHFSPSRFSFKFSSGCSCSSVEPSSSAVSSWYLRRSALIFSSLRATFFFFFSILSLHFLSSSSRLWPISSRRLRSSFISSCLRLISCISFVMLSSLAWLCLISSTILFIDSIACLFSSANCALSRLDFSSSSAIFLLYPLDSVKELQSNSSSLKPHLSTLSSVSSSGSSLIFCAAFVTAVSSFTMFLLRVISSLFLHKINLFWSTKSKSLIVNSLKESWSLEWRIRFINKINGCLEYYNFQYWAKPWGFEKFGIVFLTKKG